MLHLFLSSSLENMYKELVSDIPGFQHPGHGDLTGWAKQGISEHMLMCWPLRAVGPEQILWLCSSGVLLLNAVLTVRAHNANSHKDKGWETFTDAVVQWLNTNLDGVVFMLWGSYAQKKGAAINRVSVHALLISNVEPLYCICAFMLVFFSLQKRHHVLQTVHPSPLSAHRGFFGCGHFSKANELLKKSGKSPVDWKALWEVLHISCRSRISFLFFFVNRMRRKSFMPVNTICFCCTLNFIQLCPSCSQCCKYTFLIIVFIKMLVPLKHFQKVLVFTWCLLWSFVTVIFCLNLTTPKVVSCETNYLW